MGYFNWRSLPGWLGLVADFIVLGQVLVVVVPVFLRRDIHSASVVIFLINLDNVELSFLVGEEEYPLYSYLKPLLEFPASNLFS